MKLGPAQVAPFLARPPETIACVLFYGPDDGLVRERGEVASRAVLDGAADDPFRLSLLTQDLIRQDPARLADEAAAQSLIGGRRVVRVRDAADALAKPLAALLAGPALASLIVLEAGDLARSSSLRKLAEDAPNAAAIPCYADGPRELAALIRETARARGVTLADEALDYLVHSLGGDRLMTRQELEKLMLYAGEGGTVSLADAVAAVGDSSALAVEDVVYDALDGRSAAVEAGLSRLLQEGQSAVGILRAAQRHVQRLHLSAALVAGGQNVESVLRALRPPIFYAYEKRFSDQLAAWPVARLERLLQALTRAELACKTTGFPEETICRHVLMAAGRGGG